MKKSKRLPKSFSPPKAKRFDTMLRSIRAGRWDLVDPCDLKNLLMDLWSKVEVHHKDARKRWERFAAAIGYDLTKPGRPKKSSDWKTSEFARRMLLDYYVKRYEATAAEERLWKRDLGLI